MDKSIGLLSHFAFALLIVAAVSASAVARGDAHPVRPAHPAQQRTNQLSTASGAPHSAESKILLQNDEVLPTQNRSQAMALEAENGSLPAGEEDELKRQGLVKQVAVDHNKR